jgi:hypothetical protein
MAENKKSFLLYCDLIHTIKKLPNDKAGELFKHILSYVNDEKPETEDLIINLTFEPIKQALKRDLIKYQSIKEKNAANARKRWDATASEPMRKDAKHADSDIDNGSGIVKDTVIVNEKKKESISKEIIEMHELQKFVTEKLKLVPKMKTQLTFENCVELLKKYPRELIIEKLTAMDNKPDVCKKYVSVYLTVNTWCRDFNKMGEKKHPYTEHKPIQTKW